MADSPAPPPAPPVPELDFRLLIDAALDLITVLEPGGSIRYVNETARRLFGHDPATSIGRSAFEFIHPDDAPRLAARLAEICALPGTARDTAIYRVRAADGQYRHIESLSANRCDTPGIRGVCLIGRDVTERVRAEKAAEQVQERRRLAARIMQAGTWVWDPTTDDMEAEEDVRELTRQYPGQPWEGMGGFAQRLPPEDRPVLWEVVRRVGQGQEGHCVVRVLCEPGPVRWIYLHAVPRPDPASGRALVMGVVMDVSAQKALEAELSERQQMLSLASWGADLGVWSWYPAENRIVNDHRSAELLGQDPARAERDSAEWERTVHPEDLPRLLRQERELCAGQYDILESTFRVRRPDGKWHWVLDRGRVTERGPDGRALRVNGITMAFDAVKRTEAELSDERLRLDFALEAAGLGLWDWDATARELYVDARYEGISGLSAAEVRNHAGLFVQRVHPDDRPRLISDTLACLAGRSAGLDFEGRMLRPDGRLIRVRIQGLVPRRDENGQPARMTGTLADISARHRVQKLAEIGEDVAGVGTYEFDVGGDRFYWSRGTYRIFGLPPDFVPARGATLFLVAPASREKMTEAFRAAREEGRPFDIEFEARSLHGRPLWIRQIGRVETFEDRVVRVYGIVQDITERKALEAALLEAANREQQRLGSELHDGLGQELTGISLLLEGLARDAAAARPELAESFGQVRRLLAQAIQNTRDLAHGLAPVSLRRGGLEGALRMLADQSSAALGIPVALEMSLANGLSLTEVAGNHLYRIAQEAIANAARHGRPDSITIRLDSQRSSVTLEVRDNGAGLPPEPERGSGLGLRSMSYRAQSLNGSCRIERIEPRGTRVLVTCPQDSG